MNIVEIEISSKRNNPLFGRTEVHFTIRHEGEGTPNREIIRGELAEKLNVKKENIVVNSIHSSFGIQKSTGYAKIYKSVEKAKGQERRHILERNKIVEKIGKEKKEKLAKKPESKPEKPAEQPAEPKEEVKEEKPEEKKP